MAQNNFRLTGAKKMKYKYTFTIIALLGFLQLGNVFAENNATIDDSLVLNEVVKAIVEKVDASDKTIAVVIQNIFGEKFKRTFKLDFSQNYDTTRKSLPITNIPLNKWVYIDVIYNNEGDLEVNMNGTVVLVSQENPVKYDD